MRIAAILYMACLATIWVACGNQQDPQAIADYDSLQDPYLSNDLIEPPTIRSGPATIDSLRLLHVDSLGNLLLNFRSAIVLTGEKMEDSLLETDEATNYECKTWDLTPLQIQTILKESKPLSLPERHFNYGLHRCFYQGMLKINGVELPYRLNGASFFAIPGKDTTFLFGYEGRQYRNLLLQDTIRELYN